jgi:hypothetical protein
VLHFPANGWPAALDTARYNPSRAPVDAVSSCVTGGECLHSRNRASIPKVTGAARADGVTGAPNVAYPAYYRLAGAGL